MADAPLCPECAAGKCGNCDGSSWDDVTDGPTTCPCTHGGPAVGRPRPDEMAVAARRQAWAQARWGDWATSVDALDALIALADEEHAALRAKLAEWKRVASEIEDDRERCARGWDAAVAALAARDAAIVAEPEHQTGCPGEQGPSGKARTAAAAAEGGEVSGVGWTLYPICDDCANGVGSECHTPDCALWMRYVPTSGVVKDFGVPRGPRLGHATTADLLDELRSRIAVDYYNGGGGLGYSTVNGRPPGEAEAPVCGVNVGDTVPCRCLLPRGHPGLHQCKHESPLVADA